MPPISKLKRDRIKEQILSFLFFSFPKQLFTSNISQEIARDEEFVKSLLIELEKDRLVTRINSNKEGVKYQRRIRWRISNEAYKIYKNSQKDSNYKNILERNS